MMLGFFSRKHLHLQPRVRSYRESTASSRTSCDAVALVVVAALPCRVCAVPCVCVVVGARHPRYGCTSVLVPVSSYTRVGTIAVYLPPPQTHEYCTIPGQPGYVLV